LVGRRRDRATLPLVARVPPAWFEEVSHEPRYKPDATAKIDLLFGCKTRVIE